MKPTLKFFSHKAGCAFLLACGLIINGGVALAMDGHDHGNVHDHNNSKNQGKSANLIREVALPEGLSSAQAMAIDSTGRIWFTEKVGRKLTSYDPESNEFDTHSLPPSWGDMGFSNMAISPDGEAWFTVTRWVKGTEQPNILGRFTPEDGYFTKYTLPNNTVPEELMIDAGGTIWFIASNKNNLYRVDPKTLALKGYRIPTDNGNPKGLAADQKGHIWFSEPNTNKIGKFIPEQEAFQEYDVLTQFANPGKISIDKQGKVWFVEVTANRLGMFYPEQERFDEALIPSPGSSPVALTTDEYGNIWFLEYKGNKVGVFNPETAMFHEFDIPYFGSLPADLVIDHKRSTLWFSQSSNEAKRLGMLSIKDALAEINKQADTPPAPAAEKASNGKSSLWLVLIAALISAAMLGSWLARKSRLKGHS